MPLAASSANASSKWARSRPVSATMSIKKDAPRWRRTARAFSAVADTGGGDCSAAFRDDRVCHSPRFSRRVRAMGVFLSRVVWPRATGPVFSLRPRAGNRAQTTRPAPHSRSRAAGE